MDWMVVTGLSGKYIDNIYINCWFPLYRWSEMKKNKTGNQYPPYLKMGGGGGSGYLDLHY